MLHWKAACHSKAAVVWHDSANSLWDVLIGLTLCHQQLYSSLQITHSPWSFLIKRAWVSLKYVHVGNHINRPRVEDYIGLHLFKIPARCVFIHVRQYWAYMWIWQMRRCVVTPAAEMWQWPFSASDTRSWLRLRPGRRRLCCGNSDLKISCVSRVWSDTAPAIDIQLPRQWCAVDRC